MTDQPRLSPATGIATNLSLPELKRRALIDERGQVADLAMDFAPQIRPGLPGREFAS